MREGGERYIMIELDIEGRREKNEGVARWWDLIMPRSNENPRTAQVIPRSLQTKNCAQS